MYPLIEQWHKSGQKIADFCAAHQIKPHTFSYWQQKYRKQKGVSTGGFTKVEITSPADITSMSLEMNLPNGVRLSFAQLPEAGYLTGLIKGLAK